MREQGCVVSEDKRQVDTKETQRLKQAAASAAPAAARRQAEVPVKRAPLSIDELLAAGRQKGEDLKALKANKKLKKKKK